MAAMTTIILTHLSGTFFDAYYHCFAVLLLLKELVPLSLGERKEIYF